VAVADATSVSRTQMVPVEGLSDTPVDHSGSRRSCWQPQAVYRTVFS